MQVRSDKGRRDPRKCHHSTFPLSTALVEGAPELLDVRPFLPDVSLFLPDARQSGVVDVPFLLRWVRDGTRKRGVNLVLLCLDNDASATQLLKAVAYHVPKGAARLEAHHRRFVYGRQMRHDALTGLT